MSTPIHTAAQRPAYTEDNRPIPEFRAYATGKQLHKKHSVSLFKRLIALPSYHLILAATLVVLMAHIAYIPIWLTVFAFFCVLFQLPVIRQKFNKKNTLKSRYQLAQLILFLAGLVGFVINFGASINTDTSIGFLILCLFCKLWELHDKRDGYVTLNLSLFVLAAAFLWSQGLGISLVVLFGLIMVILGLIALADDHNETGTGRLNALAMLLVPSLPLLVVLFLFFPRLPPLWSLPSSNKQATTGVSDSMSPGDFANLSKSTALAFRVEFDGTLPDRSELYWRGLVFSQFDGITWRPSNTNMRFARPNDPLPKWAGAMGQSLGNYQIILEPTYQNWLYSLEHSLPAPRRGVAINDRFTIGSLAPIGNQFRYQAAYYPSAKIGLTLSPSEYQEALSLPATGNDKARQLANTLKEEAGGDTRQMIALVRQYILNQSFHYTLSPPMLKENRIDEFLFETRAGFCEHYASSFVFLMRSAGVPARVVVGYQGGELGRDGQSWEVRQMDAHAWAEVWLEEEGWVRIDPTAFVSPSRVENGMNALTDTLGSAMFGDGLVGQVGYQQFRLLQSMYRFSDQMGYYWQKQVVGFDQDTQKASLLKWFNVATLAQQLVLLVGGFGALMGIVSFVFWYRRRIIYHPLDAPIAHLSKQLGKKDKTLAKHPHESYLGYLKRLDANSDTDLGTLLTWYRQQRFGQAKAEKKEIHHFAQKIKALTQNIKK